MMAADKILALLVGHDSQKPMAFDALVEKTGLQPETVEMVLDHMFHTIPSAVNRCEITKGGKTQMWYWPTGMVESFKGDPVGARNHMRKWKIRNPDKPAAPQRTARVHIAPVPEHTKPMADKAVIQMEKHMAKPKKSGLKIMLEMIAEKGRVHTSELSRAIGSTSVKSQLAFRVKIGQIVRDGLWYSVADGVTKEQLLADMRGKTRAISTPQPPKAVRPAPARSSEEQSSAHHHAQHKVAQNVCSAGSAISSETPLAEARASTEKPAIIHTAETAGHVQELANALDRITELKCELEAERAKRRAEPAVMIAQLQALMTNGTSLHIHQKNIYLKDFYEKEYGIEPHEFDQAIAALEFLGRKAA